MPISETTSATVTGITVQVTEATTGNLASFEIPLPIPAGMSVSETEARVLYQKIINALEASPHLVEARGQLLTTHRADVTPDPA